MVVFHDPSRPVWPGDGIRYAQNAESHKRSPFTLPNNQVVDLETAVVAQGMYPPANPNVPLSLDTPELNLARFRIRWRILGPPGVGHPNLCLVHWGRDPQVDVRAPPGWEREVIRRYPFPPVDTPLVYPLRQLSAPQPPQHQQVQRQMQGSPPPGMQLQGGPMRPPTQDGPVAQAQTVIQPPQTFPPGSRPIVAPGQMPPASVRASMPPALLAQFEAQQRQAQAAANAAAQATSAGQAQLATPAGQSQASTQQTQAQAAAMALAQQQQIAQLRLLAGHFSFPVPFSDSRDTLSQRSYAGLRYERNHAAVAPVFDAVTTTELLTGWKAPPMLDLVDIKQQIAMLEADIKKLRDGPTSASLRAKASSPEYTALLAPLPQMMPLAEMQESALQAAALRRQAVEEAAAAVEEEERRRREAVEAEEAAKRAAEEAVVKEQILQEQARLQKTRDEQYQLVLSQELERKPSIPLVQPPDSGYGAGEHGNTFRNTSAESAQEGQPNGNAMPNAQSAQHTNAAQQIAYQQKAHLTAQYPQPEQSYPDLQQPQDGKQQFSQPFPQAVLAAHGAEDPTQQELGQPSRDGSQFGDNDDAYLFNNNFGGYEPNTFDESMFELEYLNQEEME